MTISKIISRFAFSFLILCFVNLSTSFSQLNNPQLERQWLAIKEPQHRFGTREFFSFALEATAANWRPECVEVALSHAATKQDRDPKSKTFGNFAWYWEDKLPDDRNCVEFCMQKGILLWILFQDRLTPEAKSLLSDIIKFSIEGIKRHRVSPSYSNIYIKKTWNCIAIGEYAGEPQLANEGYEMFQTWLKHTRTNGICEYLSPTYYAVDMENLGLISRYSKNPIIREKARLAIQYMWREVAANWFKPAERLGGAHSRDYDYLFGRGGLDDWVIRAGWSNYRKPSDTFFSSACWVAPDENLRNEILENYPRMVRQRWGSAPYQTASQWLGKKIAIGTAGAAYLDAMDKTFVVLFEGSNLPTCSFLMDARLDPYGKKRYTTGGGHLKAHHIFPFLASVQRENEALLLASARSGSPAFQRSGTNLTCWLSHWVIPSEIPLYIGDSEKPVQFNNSIKLPFPDTPVFLKKGDAAVGFRFIYGTTPDNNTAQVEIVDDGKEFGARRITCIHSLAPPNGRATVATFVRVAEDLDEIKFKEFRKQFSAAKANIIRNNNVLDVSVDGLVSKLRLAVDLERESRLTIDGAEQLDKNALLTVNAKEIGAPLLDKAISLEIKNK